MPKPLHFCPSVASSLLERFAVALAEERKSVAAYLEVRHSTLLADLKGTLRSSTYFPDDGPEVSLQESSQLDKAEHQTPQSLQAGSKQDQWSVSCANDAQQADGNLRVSSKEVCVSLAVPPEPQPKAGVTIERAESAWSAGFDPMHNNSKSSAALDTTNSRSRGRKSTFFVASGETLTREAVIRRLHAKLGYHAMGEWLPARDLHVCLESLTLETFDVSQLRQFVSTLYLTFSEVDSQTHKPPSFRISDATGISRLSGMSLFSFSASHDPNYLSDHIGLYFNMLVDVLCMDASDLQSTFDLYTQEQIRVVRDILLAADANAMIAELMHLRVDDLANVKPHASMLDYMEPIIGAIILLNAVLIGLQTVPEIAEHPSMMVADVFITFLFIIEFVVKLKYNGLAKHLCGPELLWNWFDLMIIMLALMDIVLYVARVDFDTSAMTIVRMARLTRLARLVRIFRVSWLKELRLVVMGLFGGLRTLFWAVILLFLIIYMVAVFLTLTIGEDVSEMEDEISENFSTLPQAAFTTFRCLLIVECAAETGNPILVTATKKYGWVVPVFYIFLFVTVSIGLMNLIMAIYIEATLREAKNENESSKEAQYRQSLHVALQLKRLLIKVCALQTGLHKGMRNSDITALLSVDNQKTLAKKTVDPSVEITKEVFMIALQDSEVQNIMSDLGIPPERAHLFDAVDADGSGELKPKELLNGLLQIRGEARKSDSAALLLAVRCLQSQFNIFDTQIGERHTELLEILTTLRRRSSAFDARMSGDSM